MAELEEMRLSWGEGQTATNVPLGMNRTSNKQYNITVSVPKYYRRSYLF